MDQLSMLDKPLFSKAVPPHRLTLCQASESLVYAVLDIDHTIVDARSMQLIAEQLGHAYTYSSLPKGGSFSAYVSLLQDRQNTARDYRRSFLAGAQPCLIPTLDVTPTDGANISTQAVDVPFTHVENLHSFCRRNGVTVANFMQAAWAVVLSIFTGNTSVYFGCLHSEHEAFEGSDNILGPLITMLV